MEECIQIRRYEELPTAKDFESLIEPKNVPAVINKQQTLSASSLSPCYVHLFTYFVYFMTNWWMDFQTEKGSVWMHQELESLLPLESIEQWPRLLAGSTSLNSHSSLSLHRSSHFSCLLHH